MKEGTLTSRYTMLMRQAYATGCCRTKLWLLRMMHQGHKLMKERVTFLFCVNKTGNHKVKPLCVGKFKQPRCFKNKNMDNLAFVYRNTPNAWMNGDLFKKWFDEQFVPTVRKHLRKKGLEPKALLLLDNCPAHPPGDTLVSKDGKIKVSYLPKNTTSRIQPLDQGIIAQFKMLYKKELLLKLVEDDCSPTQILKKIALDSVFDLGERAWGKISAESIEKCWNKGLGEAFKPESSDDDDSDDPFEDQDPFLSDDDDSEAEFEGFTEEDVSRADQILKDLFPDTAPDGVSAWLHGDDECPTYEEMSDEIIAEHALSVPTTEEEEESDSDEEPIPLPKVSEALEGLETGLRWLEGVELGDRIHILQLKQIIEIAKKKKRESMKQQPLDMFLS